MKETPVKSRAIPNGDAGRALIQALIITYDACKSELLVIIMMPLHKSVCYVFQLKLTA